MGSEHYANYTKEGMAIKVRVARRGLNLAKFAEQHNIDRARLSDLARGKRKCLKLRRLIAKELDMPELVIDN